MLLSLVGFEGNLSLLDIFLFIAFFLRGLKQKEGLILQLEGGRVDSHEKKTSPRILGGTPGSRIRLRSFACSFSSGDTLRGQHPLGPGVCNAFSPAASSMSEASSGPRRARCRLLKCHAFDCLRFRMKLLLTGHAVPKLNGPCTWLSLAINTWYTPYSQSNQPSFGTLRYPE